MVGTFFWILFLYLLGRFAFGFVVPVVRTYLRMKKKMKEMNHYPAGNTQQKENLSKTFTPKPSQGSKSDYIDFEEVE